MFRETGTEYMKQYLIRSAREGVSVKVLLLNEYFLALVTINGTEHCVLVVAHVMFCHCCPQRMVAWTRSGTDS